MSTLERLNKIQHLLFTNDAIACKAFDQEDFKYRQINFYLN